MTVERSTEPHDDMEASEGGEDIDNKQPSELDNDALLLRFKRWYRDSRQQSSAWRKDAREDYAFYDGVQWDSADVATLKEQLRPVITFNRIAPTVDTVSGMEINNRQTIQAYPRREGVAEENEQIGEAIRWVRDECDAEDEESDMFMDTVICGMGWTDTLPEYDRDADGLIVQRRLDPLEMYWDPFARQKGLRDRRWQIHRSEIDIDVAQQMFPDADRSELNADWAKEEDTAQNHPHDQTQARFYAEDQSDRDRNPRQKVTILHVQWYEKEDFYRVLNPQTGQEERLSADDWKIAAPRYKELHGKDLPAVKQQKRVYKRAFVGRKILEQGPCPCREDFTFQACTGKRDRNAKMFYGIVRSMKDPQRWANKFFAMILHNIATSGKGIIAELDAFSDPRKAESEWSKPDGITWAKAGAVAANKIMPKPAGALPAGLPDMLTFALTSLRDVSGVNLETLGQADRDQAASLEWQRRKSAFSILAWAFDSLRYYRKNQGRLTIYMIQEYISDGRLMRIEQDNGQTVYKPFIRDPKAVEYDVIVDDAPSSPDQKEATWLILGQLLPMIVGKMPIPADMWSEIIKQSPLPNSFATKMVNIIEQQKQQPPPPDPNMVKAQAQVEAQQAKTQLAQVQGQQKMQLEREKHEGDMQLAQLKGNVDIAVQQAQAQSELEIERGRAQTEMAVTAAKTSQELHLNEQRAHTDMAVTRAQAEHGMSVKADESNAKIERSGAESKAKIQRSKAEAAAKPKPKGKK